MKEPKDAAERQSRRNRLIEWLSHYTKTEPAPPAESSQEEEQLAAQAARSEGNTDLMPDNGGPLQRLRMLSTGQVFEGDGDAAPSAFYSSFTLDGQEPQAPQKRIFAALQGTARARLKLLQPPPPKEGEEPPEEPPVDGACVVTVMGGDMEAWIFCFPPARGGKPLDESALRAALEEKKVVYGVDEALLHRLAAGEGAFKLARIAQGTPAQDGTDGQVKDYVPREQSASPQAKENGTVDFKDLNWLRPVAKGDLLCEMVPPGEPVAGSTVTGRKLEGRPGRKVTVPAGKNTLLDESGLRLTSGIDGQVSFAGGKFHVSQMLSIPGSVDTSTGNLRVVGDIVINGDVLEGFLVQASGNVVVRGMVEGATINAGGCIQIGNGMSGNGHGSLTAQGEIRAKYLENCVVQATGSIYAESLINCQVSCDDSVYITAGRGSIIGGAVRTRYRVQANIIGNKSNRITSLQLGLSSDQIKELSALRTEVAQRNKEKTEAEKNLQFLEKQLPSTLNPQQKQLRDQLRLQMTTLQLRCAQKEKALATLEAAMEDVSQCRVQGGIIYPNTQIVIGRLNRTITETAHNCNIYATPEGIAIGMK